MQGNKSINNNTAGLESNNSINLLDYIFNIVNNYFDKIYSFVHIIVYNSMANLHTNTNPWLNRHFV